jgi:hypothetical protein
MGSIETAAMNCHQLLDNAKKECPSEPWTEACKSAQGAWIDVCSGTKTVPPRRPLPFKPGRTEAVCNTLWPLASECWMDWTKAKGANLFHFRMGPFYGDAEHEIDWQEFGGPYAGGPGSDWNPAFWQKYRELLAHAREIGANVEVVVIDTWYCKHANSDWGDQPMPWPQSDIDACGRAPSPEQEKYIRRVVSEAKDAPHVIWLTDNEGGEIRGTKREWYEWVRSVIRDEEAKSGGAVRMIGTNNTDFCGAPFDYCATHAKTSLSSTIGGAHTENNERNPAFSPPEEHAYFCEARAAGNHWWFWRAEMTEAQMEVTLGLFGGGCGSAGCVAPHPDDPYWSAASAPGVPTYSPEMRSSQLMAQLNQAKATVGDRCGATGIDPAGIATIFQGCLDTNGLIAAELRRQGLCASGPWVDAVAALAPDSRWEELHVCSYGNGCYTGNPYKGAWDYLGDSPTPPPGSCPQDVPTVDQISCKLHQATNAIYDCTPKANGQPILPEGDPNRSACELKAMGGQWPVYSVTGPGLTVAPRENPMQFQLKGTGSGVVSCVVPVGTFCNLSVSQ